MTILLFPESRLYPLLPGIECRCAPGLKETCMMNRIGGGSYLEIHTDQGLVGLCSDMDAPALERSRAQLKGMRWSSNRKAAHRSIYQAQGFGLDDE